MTRRDRGTDDWIDRTERLRNRAAAEARAGLLRVHEGVERVTIEQCGDMFVVSYRVARSFIEGLERDDLEF